jgi:hypothetical protein
VSLHGGNILRDLAMKMITGRTPDRERQPPGTKFLPLDIRSFLVIIGDNLSNHNGCEGGK